jgi:hypothetical protein
MSPDDLPVRLKFCGSLQHQHHHAGEEIFFYEIIGKKEVRFSRNCAYNVYNSSIWAQNSPYSSHELKYQGDYALKF